MLPSDQMPVHSAVGNTRFQELLALGLEPMAHVEAQCLRLRMQHNALETRFLRYRQQRSKQRATHSTLAPFAQNRHAADVPIGEQAPRADCPSVRSFGDHMLADRVELVAFQLERHTLLPHEHVETNLS